MFAATRQSAERGIVVFPVRIAPQPHPMVVLPNCGSVVFAESRLAMRTNTKLPWRMVAPAHVAAVVKGSVFLMTRGSTQ
jgi:hypothetical protein